LKDPTQESLKYPMRMPIFEEILVKMLSNG
jgi:hypothetical protein